MFKNTNNWPLEHWHIEISSRCPLQCPRCTRQEVPNGLVNTDLNLDWFEHNFSDIIKSVKKITFCGDDGDPIYAPDLLKVSKWIKKTNPDCQIVIVTNGSGKKKEWWQEFSRIFDQNDHIHFSIDGDHSNNTDYRVNADWQSIMDAIQTINDQGCQIFKTWATIAFSFNTAKLPFMKWMAKDKKFDYFQLTKSTKFGSNYSAYPKDDYLEPDAEFVSQGRFSREIESISDRVWKDNCLELYEQRYITQKAIGDIQPLCGVGNKGLYINSQGKFYPCCWTGLRYEHNNGVFDYVVREGKTLPEILDDPEWSRLQQDFLNGTCPSECGEKCSVKKWNKTHATNW